MGKKVCTKCGVGTEFYMKDGKPVGSCKECCKKASRATRFNPAGYANRLYASRVSAVNSSLSRAGSLSFSKEQFLEWLFTQPLYIDLFNAFRDSGFDTQKAPSIDRIDASKGYSLDNIQLMTRYENMRKGFFDTASVPLRSNKSGATGVVFLERLGKWEARMTQDNKRITLGSYDSKEEAVAARRDAELLRKEGREQPSRSRNTSGVVGVAFHKDLQRWRASISTKGKRIQLGVYQSMEEAVSARYKAEALLKEGKPISSVRPSCKSGTVGVSFCPSTNKWSASLQHKGKQYNLGIFADKEQAVATRIAAEDRVKQGLTPK